MKLINKFLLAVLLVMIVLVIIPSTMTIFNNAYTVQAATIKINARSKVLNVGETYTLKLAGTKKKITWYSSNTKIATVSSSGKVIAKSKGTATITAKIGSYKYTCKLRVENPTINRSSLSMFPSNTYTLKVSGTTQSIKWYSSNTNIATVTYNGKVTAKSKGSATITAKVGNKKLNCKITVSSYESNIKVSFLRTATSVIALLTNNNSSAISISPKMTFYNASGAMQSVDSEFNYCFEPKSTIAMEFKSYNPSTYRSQTYSSYKLNLGNVSKSYYNTYATNAISVLSNLTDGSVMAEVTNKSGKKLSSINLSIIYYDESGNVIGYDKTYAHCEAIDSTDYLQFSFPRDDDYKKIVPSDYKIYVNYAYKY